MVDADGLVAAIGQQAAGYRDLLRLAETQRRHVRAGQTDALLDVLQQRQAVLDRIMAAEAVVGPARRDWAAVAAGLPAERRATAERLLVETRTLLEQITAGDRDDVLILQQRRLNLGRQIDRTRAAKTVNRNYAAAAYGTPKPTINVRT